MFAISTGVRYDIVITFPPPSSAPPAQPFVASLELPKRTFLYIKFRHRFFVFLDFGSIFQFRWFSMFSAPLFRAAILHRFPIDSDHILIFLLIHFPFAHASCKTFKNHCFHIEFTCFYASEHMSFDDFHDLFRYLFWH